ncbi:hypothetical protein OEZ85_002496 [Tetradesmus obliquus]|uniref:Uncharacterized protein n=1 Tax=Tetradesmus obliquus TaxID=3088 RepID=A0ABY8U0C6_TETOB|nr:hypothetical protein OEZ85_002496 [Tetradesmus obliquus]
MSQRLRGQQTTKGAVARSSWPLHSLAAQVLARSVKIGFLDFSKHSSIEALAEWHYVRALGNTGKTPQQLEAAGAEDGYSSRGGQHHRPQRWGEYAQLLRAIDAARDKLTEQARKASQQPHCLARVEPVAAARELDEQRKLLRLSVCEFREFLNHTGKG